MNTWTEEVSQYVDEVESTSNSIDQSLDDSRVATGKLDTPEVSAATKRLEGFTHYLQALVMRREELLSDDRAPSDGSTLTEKLLSTRRIDDARLGKRCEAASVAMKQTHERAVALFVCQYHLADLTSELSKTLLRDVRTSTYNQSGQVDATGRSGGGLLDEAA